MHMFLYVYLHVLTGILILNGGVLKVNWTLKINKTVIFMPDSYTPKLKK